MKIRGFEPITIKNRITREEPILPTRADKGSAGYDLFSPIRYILAPHEMKTIWLDVKCYMQEDEVLFVYPRSSMGKVRVTLANGTGIIDSSYYNNEKNEGNIGLMLVNNSDEPFFIEIGQAIGQGVFMKYLIADNDQPRKAKRTGGFGSSDERGQI